MRIPKSALLSLLAVLTVSAYYLVLFTNWGNPYHGGSYRGAVFSQAVAVLAVFACLEVIRTEKAFFIRALAGALGVPLVAVIALTLWYGLRRYIAV
jgi:energy-coupling factor transporter transmembrane protein EcfT